MAKKQQTYYYVIVFTSQGAKYVTGLDYSTKTAMWNITDTPKSMSQLQAEDIQTGLLWNGYNCAVVISRFEIDTHPYNYADYECKFERKEQERV